MNTEITEILDRMRSFGYQAAEVADEIKRQIEYARQGMSKIVNEKEK